MNSICAMAMSITRRRRHFENFCSYIFFFGYPTTQISLNLICQSWGAAHCDQLCSQFYKFGCYTRLAKHIVPR